MKYELPKTVIQAGLRNAIILTNTLLAYNVLPEVEVKRRILVNKFHGKTATDHRRFNIVQGKKDEKTGSLISFTAFF